MSWWPKLHRDSRAVRCAGLWVGTDRLHLRLATLTPRGAEIAAGISRPIAGGPLSAGIADIIAGSGCPSGETPALWVGIPAAAVTSGMRVITPPLPDHVLDFPDTRRMVIPPHLLAPDLAVEVGRLTWGGGRVFAIAACRRDQLDTLTGALTGAGIDGPTLEPIPSAALRISFHDAPAESADNLWIRLLVGPEGAIACLVYRTELLAWASSGPLPEDGPSIVLHRLIEEMAGRAREIPGSSLAGVLVQGAPAELVSSLASRCSLAVVDAPGRVLDGDAIAAGLALAGLGSPPAAPRFGGARMPRDLRAPERPLGEAVFGLLAIALLAGTLAIRTGELRKASTALERSLAAERTSLEGMGELVAERDRLVAEVRGQSRFVDRPVSWSRSLLRLAQAMPDQARLISVEGSRSPDPTAPDGGNSYSLALTSPDRGVFQRMFLTDRYLRRAFGRVDVLMSPPAPGDLNATFHLLGRGTGPVLDDEAVGAR